VRTPLSDLDLTAHLRDPAIKQRFVTPMFDIIAPRYDDFTRRFSFGMDARWKREAIRRALAATPPDGTVLDVACGTGDLALAVAASRPRTRVTGVDASAKMIEAASDRVRGAGLPNVTLRVADLMALENADASVDVVTAGYALRNVPDWRGGLRELSRVLRPGGRLITLDFYRPRHPLWRRVFLAYLRAAGDVVGWLWHRNAVVYGYIAPSIDHFTSWQEFSAELASSGFTNIESRTYLSGGLAIHEATRR
jgi:ubiquinone/menaquinone biosynthesis methyltransferase